MADDLAKRHMTRLAGFKSFRSVFDQHWQDIRDFIRPNATMFTGSETAGRKNRENVLENIAEAASKLLQSALHGHLTNPGTKWAGLRATETALNDDEEVAEWNELAMADQFSIYESSDSGHAEALPQVYGELADFGNGCLYVADRPGKVPLFAARPLSEIHIEQNNQGATDTVYRDFTLSARQAVQEWGKDKVGQKVLNAANGTKSEETFRFLHAVFPRADRRPGSMNARDLPFASIWIAQDDNQTIKEGGFHEMPFIVPRWEVMAGERYGRGPGTVALPDVKMLQREMQSIIKALEQAVRPPMEAVDDGILGDIDLRDGAINWARPDLIGNRRRALEPILTGANPSLGEDHADRVRNRIERAYYNHLLQITRDPRMTATHVLKIDEETLLVLGPFLGRVQAGLLGPKIGRVLGIQLRNGRLPPPPPQLRSVEVEYMSPLAKAQRLSEVRALSQQIDVMRPLIDLDPAIIDNLDQDAAFRHAADRLGVPHLLLRDPRLVEAMRQARQEAAAAQAQAEQAAQGAAAFQSAGQGAAAFAGADAQAANAA